MVHSANLTVCHDMPGYIMVSTWYISRYISAFGLFWPSVCTKCDLLKITLIWGTGWKRKKNVFGITRKVLICVWPIYVFPARHDVSRHCLFESCFGPNGLTQILDIVPLLNRANISQNDKVAYFDNFTLQASINLTSVLRATMYGFDVNTCLEFL